MSYKKGSDDDLFDFERKNVEGGDVSLCPGKRKKFFLFEDCWKSVNIFYDDISNKTGREEVKKIFDLFQTSTRRKNCTLGVVVNILNLYHF